MPSYPSPKDLSFSQSRPYLKTLGTDLLDFLQEVQRDHGDFVHLKVPLFKVMVISDPEWVRLLMTNLHTNLQKPQILKKRAARYGTTGVFIDDGEKWKRGRQQFTELFHRKRIAEAPNLATHITGKFDRMIAANNEQTVVHFFFELVMDVVLQFTYDFPSGRLDPDITELFFSVHDLFYGDLNRPMVAPMWMPTPHNLVIKKINNRFQHNVDTIIEHVAQQRPDAPNLGDEVNTMFLAGMEAPSAMLSWCLYNIVERPEVAATLLASVESDPADVSSAKIQSFINEVMRLFPAAYLFNREVATEFTHHNIVFPKGTQLFMAPYLVHRNETAFGESRTFRWDRFLETTNKMHLPFGAGARYCPGAQFSYVIAEIIMRHLLLHYRVENVSLMPIKPTPMLSLSPGPQFRCVLRRKDA